MMITLTDADLRDPMDSEETCCVVEGPVERDADGSCYCQRAMNNEWDNSPGGSPLLYLHLKLSGRKPDAAPRYFEIPIR